MENHKAIPGLLDIGNKSEDQNRRVSTYNGKGQSSETETLPVEFIEKKD
jgi:hypothetical protein